MQWFGEKIIWKRSHSAQSRLCYEMFRDMGRGHNIYNDIYLKSIEFMVFLLHIKELHIMSFSRNLLGITVLPFKAHVSIFIFFKKTPTHKSKHRKRLSHIWRNTAILMALQNMGPK